MESKGSPADVKLNHLAKELGTRDSAESRGVAQAFWERYVQPRSEWKAEMTFPAT